MKKFTRRVFWLIRVFIVRVINFTRICSTRINGTLISVYAFKELHHNLSVPQKNKILCKPLVIRVLSALKMRNFPMIFSKNFVEGHGPPDISVGRGVGKRVLPPP